MTPELAAERAAELLECAHARYFEPEQVKGLVAVADGWTRLHAALAATQARDFLAVKTEPVNIGGLTVKDVDAEKISEEFEKQLVSWPRIERKPALNLAFFPADPPIVRAGGADHEVVGWNVKVGPEGVGYIELQVVKLDRKR